MKKIILKTKKEIYDIVVSDEDCQRVLNDIDKFDIYITNLYTIDVSQENFVSVEVEDIE